MCRTAWYLKQRKVALKCFEIASGNNNVAPALRTKMDVCEAIHMLADLTDLNPNEVLKQRLSRKQMDGYQANRRIEASRKLFFFLISEICYYIFAKIYLSQVAGTSIKRLRN